MQKTNHLPKNSLELSKIFHEIKNPLTLINSSLQLIESEHPEVKEFHYWKQTIKDVQNLRFLLDDLSSFQKGELLNPTIIHLFDFTEDLLESMEGFLTEHGMSLTLDCDSFDLDFCADSQKLRQAIVNLLKNAAESSKSGDSVSLRFHVEAPDLHIFVEDQGCGIRPEHMAHIFEPFHTTKSYGTGLGLPIVKKIVESHHGSISVRSEYGTGTCFHIQLPLKIQQTVS